MSIEDNKSVLIKELIGLCFEKYLQKQLKYLNTEDNVSQELNSLRTESEVKTQKLENLIESKFKTKNKETQINGHKSESNDDYSLKLKTILVNGVTKEDEEKESILKKQLIGDIKPFDNCLKPKNGFNKDINTTIECNNNSEGTVLRKYLSVSSDTNSGDKTSENIPEVVVIDSDDEEMSCVSTATMETIVNTNSFGSYSSNYCQSIPKPKLTICMNSSEKLATNGLKQVTLKWTIPEMTSYLISKYLIYMSRNCGINGIQSNPIGAVEAMELPMACTLSNLSYGSYKFYIRAKDRDNRIGPPSNIETVNIF